MGNYTFVCTVLKSIDIFNGTLLKLIIVENFHGTLTTVVRAQNDTSKTANITDVKVIILSSKLPKCRLLQ